MPYPNMVRCHSEKNRHHHHRPGGIFSKRLGTRLNGAHQGLQTPNEGINQRNLKIWADVADKISFDPS